MAALEDPEGLGPGILSSLIADAFNATATRVWLALRNGKRRNEANEALSNLHDHLIGHPAISPPSIARLAQLNLPVPATAVQNALQSVEVRSVVRQITAALALGRDDLDDDLLDLFARALSDRLQPESPGQLVETATVLYEITCETIRESLLSVDGSDAAWVIEGASAPVLLQATLDSIDSSLKLMSAAAQTDSAAIDAWLTAYRKAVASEHGSIIPPDFRDRTPVPIETLYVPGRLHTDDPKGAIAETSVLDLLETADREVILGDPGGGKSTATAAMAHNIATQDPAHVPFVVVLREYSPNADSHSIVEHIEKQARTRYQVDEPPSGLLASLLTVGRGVVFFDGLDELLDASRRREITQRVEAFSTRYPAARIIVTSRKVGYGEARLDPTAFRTHLLSEYNDDDIETYVGNWFRNQGLSSSVTESAVAGFLTESESIPDLRSNPLLLALLCIIYRGRNYLPRNRIGVYQQCTELLFETWDKSRSIGFEFDFEVQMQNALDYLAYWMFTLPDTTKEGVGEEALISELVGFFATEAYEGEVAARRAASEFIEFCRGRAWVLSEAGTTGDGEALYKFTHRTFMEYFAARQLTRLNPEPNRLAREILPRVAKSEWDTVAQLAVHLISRSAVQGADRVFERLLQSSASRSTVYRDHVVGFIFRCMSFLPVAPQVVRKAVTASLSDFSRLMRNPPKKRPFAASWQSFLPTDELLAPTIWDEFQKQFDVWMAEDGSEGVDTARRALLSMPTGAVHGSLPDPSDRWLLWQPRVTTLAIERTPELLSRSSDPLATSIDLWAIGAADMRKLVEMNSGDGALPLDFLLWERKAWPTGEPFEALAILAAGMKPSVFASSPSVMKNWGELFVELCEYQDVWTTEPVAHRIEVSSEADSRPDGIDEASDVDISSLTDRFRETVAGWLLLVAIVAECEQPVVGPAKGRSLSYSQSLMRFRANGTRPTGRLGGYFASLPNDRVDFFDRWLAREFDLTTGDPAAAAT